MVSPDLPIALGHRSDYYLIKALKAGEEGGCNVGVYLVKERSTRKTYIEKRVDARVIKTGYAQREIGAMLQLQKHPNIIHIRGYDLDYRHAGHGSIFMQHCELGSVDGLIRKYRKHKERLYDEGFLWKVFWDISLALCYLWTGRSDYTTRKCAKEQRSVEAHEGWNGYIHRDIKPGNLFLTWKYPTDGDKCNYPSVILGDFGLCTSVEDIKAGRASGTKVSGATPAFSPPEAPAFKTRSDVYQLALVVHCLSQMKDYPDTSRYLHSEPLHHHYKSRELNDLLVHCLQPDPSRRPYPHDLPMLVWRRYKTWRRSREGEGEALRKWAFD